MWATRELSCARQNDCRKKNRDSDSAVPFFFFNLRFSDAFPATRRGRRSNCRNYETTANCDSPTNRPTDAPGLIPKPCRRETSPGIAPLGGLQQIRFWRPDDSNGQDFQPSLGQSRSPQIRRSRYAATASKRRRRGPPQRFSKFPRQVEQAGSRAPSTPRYSVAR